MLFLNEREVKMEKKYQVIVYLIIVSFFIFFTSLSSNIRTITMFKRTNENMHKNNESEGNFGLILLWTRTYFIAQRHQLTNHIKCDEYECQISRNRSLLSQSDLVVFNSRYAKGE